MRIVNRCDKSQWEEFVLSFKSSNIFSSPEMLEAFVKSKGFEVYTGFVLDDNDIVASVFPILVKIDIPFFQKYSSRLILYASPLYQNTSTGIEGLKILLNHLKKIAQKKALFLEIRNSESMLMSSHIFQELNFIYIPYQNYLIHLELGQTALWNRLSSYTRNHIRKGEKRGMIIREIIEDELITVINIIEQLYIRKRIPFIHKSIFYNAYRHLKNKNIRITVCDLNKQIIGTRITLNYQRTIFDWYAATMDGYNEFYINEALVWDTIRWGCQNGYSLFDFGGAGIRGEEYGPAKFKEKFHGELVEYGRYRYIPNQFTYKAAQKLYKLRTVKK